MQFRSEDFKHISQVLYSPKQPANKTRQCFNVNTEYDPGAKSIGYDVYDRRGKARISASGGNSKNTPFVGESVSQVTQGVYEIDMGVEYLQSELDP